MTRINLLPPEITQKRKDEGRWTWVIAAIVAVFVVIAVVYLGVLIQVITKQADVAALQQQADAQSGQVQRFSIFQTKQEDMLRRQNVVKAALIGRVDWGEVLYETSLVMPADMFLTRFLGEGADTSATPSATFEGQSANIIDVGSNSGYDSVAKLLVRLTDLPDVNNVWLTNADKQAPVSPTGPSSPSTALSADSFIKWQITAKVSPPRSDSSTSTVGVSPITPQP